MLSREEKHPCTESSQQQFMFKALNRAVTSHYFCSHPTAMWGNYREETEKQDHKPGFSTSKRFTCHIFTCQKYMCSSDTTKLITIILSNSSTFSIRLGELRLYCTFFYCRRNRAPKKFLLGVLWGSLYCPDLITDFFVFKGLYFQISQYSGTVRRLSEKSFLV